MRVTAGMGVRGSCVARKPAYGVHTCCVCDFAQRRGATHVIIIYMAIWLNEGTIMCDFASRYRETKRERIQRAGSMEAEFIDMSIHSCYFTIYMDASIVHIDLYPR